MFRMGECAIAHGIIKAAMIRSPLVRRTGVMAAFILGMVLVKRNVSE